MRRRSDRLSVVHGGTLVVITVLVALAACGDDESTASTSTSTTVPSVDEPPTCEEWTSRPVTADEVEDGCAVPFESGIEGYVQAGMASFECDDGRTIFWGDAGWGYVGEPMRSLPGSEFVAPQAEQDACGVPPLPPTVPPPLLPE